MRKHRLVKFIATSLLAFLGMVIIVACTDGSRKVVKAFPKKDSVVVQKQTDLPQRVFKNLETASIPFTMIGMFLYKLRIPRGR